MYLVACTLPVYDINFTVDFLVPEIIAAAVVQKLVSFLGSLLLLFICCYRFAVYYACLSSLTTPNIYGYTHSTNSPFTYSHSRHFASQ